MMRSVVAILVFVLCGTAALAEPSALVTLGTANRGSLSPDISAYGTVVSDPNHQIAVVAGHDARITQVFVRLGQTVQKDAPLVTLQNAPSSMVQYAQAASALSFAAKDLAQTQRLYNEQLATRGQLAAAQKAYADAQSAVTQQRLMGADHASQTLTAPVTGVIVALTGARGDGVSAGAAIATIASPGGLVVDLGIEPAAAPDVHPGASIWFKAPGSQQSMGSQILTIGAMLDSQSRLVRATARVPDALVARLIVGTTLNAEIALSSRKGIVVPRVALLSDNDGMFVLVVTSEIAHRRAVSVGFEVGSDALILSGLRGGERIVVAGTAGVTDGMHVRTH